MMDPIVLLSELMAAMLYLVMKPLSLFKSLFVFAVRTTLVVFFTWVELIKAAISLHINLFQNTLMWMLAFACLPLRILTAIFRERELEDYLFDSQMELQNLESYKCELEDKLKIAIKERKILKSMLQEQERQNELAITKIEFLEMESQDLRDENLRLKQIQGKINSRPSIQSVVSRKMEIKEEMNQRKNTAFLQSLFSSMLSMIVGVILWHTGHAYVPLVVALFVVVGMSMKSVVQFISTVENQLAYDAVALLSFNWFMLGALTFPTLHRVAPCFAAVWIA